jgi:aryl-alcohol dehydrogenase-like predicted oxidoreductase
MNGAWGARALGSQGLKVSPMGMGCMGLTSFYGADTANAKPEEVIARSIDLGINLIDTADAYGPFVNEEAVGAALRGRRHEVVLCTKFGVRREADDSSGITAIGVSGRADYVKQACDASLKRLQTDHVDLYYMHRHDPDTPIEETAGALADLVRAGKVGALGYCEIGPTLIRRAHAVHPITAIQAEYSLWHRDPEDTVLPVLQELGIGLVCYSPLGRGFLTGKIRSLDDLAADDWRRQSPRFQGANFARNLELVERIEAMARLRGATPAQLALAWLVARGATPLQGATSIEQLEENVAALSFPIGPAELAEIEAIAPRGNTAGEAWPEGSIGARVDPESRSRS